MKWLRYIVLLAVLMTAVFWWITRPAEGVGAASVSSLTGDSERGELMFHIGGCASCHEQEKGPDDAPGTAALGGGQRFVTDFGTFIAPNISPHPENGLGIWSPDEFANAMLHGVSPAGQHYYPAFPYASYTRMQLQDVVDLKAYLDTLAVSERHNEPHLLQFPFSVRRGLGLWKWLYLDREPVVRLENPDQTLQRGQYLVEGPGHCAECHTPRNLIGGFDRSRWLAGAPNPDGEGRIPNITPHPSGLAGWDSVDIAEYLSSGFTPDYDVVGSSMAEVVENTAHLSQTDREAIAAYLHAIPALEKAGPDKKTDQ